MKTISIFGIGRSGTSYLVKALSQSDCILLGNISLRFYENRDERKINDRICRDFFGAKIGYLPYGKIKDIELPTCYYEETKEFYKRYALLNTDNGHEKCKYFLFKNIRGTLVFDIWENNIDICIGALRRPSEVIQSYIHHKFIRVDNPESIMLEYWIEFNRRLLDIFVNSGKECYLFDFNGDIEYQINFLDNKLGLNLKKNIYDKSKVNVHNENITNSPEAMEIFNKLKEFAIK